MRYITIIIFVLFGFTSFAQNTVYDAELAEKLGGDDYGMKNFIFVILKTGPAEITNEDSLKTLFQGHFNNINALVESGKLIVAGPFGDNARSYRGMFILDVTTPEEAHALLQNDPTIAQGIFEVEMTPWYGSAALPTYLENHKKIEKKSP